MRRRDFLIGSGALVGMMPWLGRAAIAQGKPSQMVLMTWGGLWGDSMRDGVDAAFEKTTLIFVIRSAGLEPRS